MECQERGAGEILLTSMDRDGTRMVMTFPQQDHESNAG
jgi:imidazole glycerol phosphate synthase subunit HisF